MKIADGKQLKIGKPNEYRIYVNVSPFRISVLTGSPLWWKLFSMNEANSEISIRKFSPPKYVKFRE